MRQVTMVTWLVSIFLLIMQCSENESLNVFNGRMETVSGPIDKSYKYAPYIYSIRPDSIIPVSLILDSIRLDSIKRNTPILDSIKLNSLKLDSIKLDSIKRKSIVPDSIKWVYEYPSGGPSRVSIILSGKIVTDSMDPATGALIDIGIGQNHLDLGVETYFDSVRIVHLPFDSVGGFLATVPIAVSQSSGLLLPTSSRLFVKMVNITANPDTTLHTFDTAQYTLDTIQLVNPHAARGQR
jgi:hypothetical protein